jgi:hypothetical protein
MEQLLHKYLSSYYFIDTSDVGNDGIYLLNDTRRYKAPIYGINLLNELNHIFNLEKGYLQSNIDNWALSIKEDVDLEWFWLQEDLFNFPISHQIAARTVGLDLVSVQPMDGPVGQLLYLDYNYGTGATETVAVNLNRGDKGNNNGRIYNEEIYRQNVLNIVNHYHDTPIIEHPTPQIEINVNDRDDSLVYSTLQKWETLIGLSSRKREE